MPTLSNVNHEEFCQHYAAAADGAIRGNAYRAYLAAGYKNGTGARGTAHRLMQRPEVVARIAELKSEQFRRLHMTVEEILAQLARIARADVRDVFDESGALLPVRSIDPDTAAALTSVEVVTTRAPSGESTDVEYTAKIRLADKIQALRTLAQHAKLIGNDGDGADRLAHALADRLEAARKRRKST